MITLIGPTCTEHRDLREAMRNATFHMVATCECSACANERAAVERSFCDFDDDCIETITGIKGGDEMAIYEVLDCATPAERARFIERVRAAGSIGATRYLCGDLRERLMAATCTRCVGVVGRLCVVCGGHGSVVVAPKPDAMLDGKRPTTAMEAMR